MSTTRPSSGMYLNDGKEPGRGNVCVSGYDSGKPNYALSNFENNGGKGYDFVDPDIGKVHFETSEHYLHFQKLSKDAKLANKDKWEAEKSPGAILSGIRDSSSPFFIPDKDYKGGKFDKDWWDGKDGNPGHKVAVQMQINAAKYQQSESFRESIDEAIKLGSALGDGKGPVSIIEDTSSKKSGQPEIIWGTGASGEGTNILGNTQTAFAQMVEKNRERMLSGAPPQLSDYQSDEVNQKYSEAQQQYKEGVQKAFQHVRQQSGKNSGVGQPDTSDLGDDLSQRAVVGTDGKVTKQSFATSPTPTPTPTSTATIPSSTSSSTSTSESDAEKLEKETERLRELQTTAERLSMEAGDKERTAEDLKRKADEDQEKATLAKQEFDGLETEANKLTDLTTKVDLAKVAARKAELDLTNHIATDPDIQLLKTESDKAEKTYKDSIVPPSTEGDPALKTKAGDAKQKYDQACVDKGIADPEWKSTFDELTGKRNTANSELDTLVKAQVTSQESKDKLDEARAKVESTKLTADASKQAYTQANTLAEQSKQASIDANKEVEKQQQKVDQLTQSTSPESKRSEEEQKKEEAKKQAEQQKRDKERENTRKMQFAELYSNKRGWPRDQWENIYDPNSGEKDADKDTPRLSSGSGDKDFETKPGRYQHPKHGGADIRYYEDGSVKPIPPSKFGVWNKDGYSASMDFIAGRLGASTIKISLPMANDPRLKSHNKKQLRELLQMAHKKGLSVEFDKSTMDFLDTLSNKDAKRFTRARDLLAQNAMKNEMLVGAGDTKELNNAKIKAGEGILGGKATEAEYTKSKLDGKTTIDDKLSVVDAELDKLDKHASDMRDLNQRMQSLSKAAEGLLSKPDNLADLHREHIYRTKWQRFKDLIRPNVRENAKRYEDYTQGIADIESKFEKEKDKRGKLVESIDKKLDKLESLRAEWKKELDKLKADNGRKPDSDPSKKKMEDKIKKLEKKLDDIDGKLKEGKKEVADIKKNEQDFKAKIVAAKEKAEQYKASKQAKIGN